MGKYNLHSLLWLCSLSILIFRYTHIICCIYQLFISFYCKLVSHCMDIPQIGYPFTCWWAFELLPVSSYYNFLKNVLNVHLQVFVWTYTFISLGVEWLYYILGIYLSFKKMVKLLSKAVVWFTFLPGGYEHSGSSTYLLTLHRVSLFFFPPF